MSQTVQPQLKQLIHVRVHPITQLKQLIHVPVRPITAQAAVYVPVFQSQLKQLIHVPIRPITAQAADSCPSLSDHSSSS
jgi:hypothetical protein